MRKNSKKDKFFLGKKNQKPWGVPIRPKPLTGRAITEVARRSVVAGCPAPTRFTVGLKNIN
jgi:hypothetical protein